MFLSSFICFCNIIKHIRYHPHYHGSTALHVSGGASGAIIVDDSDTGELPAAFAALPETLLFLTVVHGLSALDTEAGSAYGATSPADTQIFVNGQAAGVSVPVTDGAWVRLRFVYS